MGAAVAAGRVGSLAGPLFPLALLASGRGATQVLLAVLPIVIACGACARLVSRIGINCRPNAPGEWPLPQRDVRFGYDREMLDYRKVDSLAE